MVTSVSGSALVKTRETALITFLATDLVVDFGLVLAADVEADSALADGFLPTASIFFSEIFFTMGEGLALGLAFLVGAADLG